MAEELRQLAAFVPSFRLEELPPEILSAARFCVLDTMGAALGAAGSREIADIFAEYQAWSGPGKNGRTACAWGTACEGRVVFRPAGQRAAES